MLSYGGMSGAVRGHRTPDLLHTTQALCRLSYHSLKGEKRAIVLYSITDVLRFTQTYC